MCQAMSVVNILCQIFLPFLGFALIFTICMRIYENKRRNLHGAVRSGLSGKSILITGASSGLGRALAEQFHAAGAKVILASRDMGKLHEIRNALMAKQIHAFHPEVCYLNLSDLSMIEDAVGDILKMTNGRLDVLVNNAGMSMRGTCLTTSMDVHQQLMLVNYFGHVKLTQLLLQAMMDTAGSSSNPCIICISSVQGRISIPYRSAYSASKHAFQAYFDCLRSELSISKYPIRVLLVSPGYIRTNLSINATTARGEKYAKLDETIRKGIPPHLASKRIIDAFLDGSEELILAPMNAKLAIVVRALIPRLYFWIMAKRAAQV